jgi:hypothetical protein
MLRCERPRPSKDEGGQMSYRLGGDLWNGVPRVSLAANHRHARQRSQACADSSALPSIHAFAATPRRGWLGKARAGRL